MLLWLLLSPGSGFAQKPGPQPAELRQRLSTAPDSAHSRLFRLLGYHYAYTNFDSAWHYARQAQQAAQAQHSDQDLYLSYGQLGILYGMRGNTEASLRMFMAQLPLNRLRPDSIVGRPIILSNIANSYYSQGKYAAAAGMLMQARRADAKAHNISGVIADLSNLNQVLLKQHLPRQALQASVQGADLLRHLPTPSPPDQQVYLSMVDALYDLGRYAAARDTCLATVPRLQLGQQEAYAQHLLMRCYLQLHNLPAAEQAGQQALLHAKAAGMLDEQRSVQAMLGQVAARRGNYALAYERQQLADSLTARLTRTSNAKTVEDMQFRYDTGQREAHVAALAQRVQAFRWQAGLGAALAVAALLAAAFVYRAKRLQAQVFRQREELRAQQAAQQAQAEAARQQQLETQRQLETAERARLEQELAGTQREQASAALFAQQKTRLLEDLTTGLDALSQRVPAAHRPSVAELKKSIGQHLRVGEDWERAVLHFEKIHPEFFAHLRQRCPSLTAGELKQCAYVKLDLTNKDIASLLNIEPGSVKISHYRIKKKLELPESKTLREFILSV